MRCYVRVPLGKSGRVETYCYEPLDDEGKCPKHGAQVEPKKEIKKDSTE